MEREIAYQKGGLDDWRVEYPEHGMAILTRVDPEAGATHRKTITQCGACFATMTEVTP
jgi:hypothetical protein